jgi:enoyl reductase
VAFPQRLGNELAGVIDQVGPGLHGFKVGDEVLRFPTLEAQAEAVVTSDEQLVLKPSAMSWEVAGALSAAGQTRVHRCQSPGRR